MTGEAIVTVSAAVVALTQLMKWAMIPDRWGPAAVLVLAALGVGLWMFSQGMVTRADTFAVFAGWIAVATSAAGVFGFARAVQSSDVTAGRRPPAGAGDHTTLPPHG